MHIRILFNYIIGSSAYTCKFLAVQKQCNMIFSSITYIIIATCVLAIVSLVHVHIL